jgi:YVTN family beta-propeller protein
MKITKRIPLTGRPNNIAIDNGKGYVAITGQNGGADVIDPSRRSAGASSAFSAASQHVHHPRQQVVGPAPRAARWRRSSTRSSAPRGRSISGGVRPICFEANPTARRSACSARSRTCTASRSSTGRSQGSGRINLPDLPPARATRDQGAPAHGILIAPDGKTLWSTSKFNSAVYAYSMPDLKYLGEVKVGKVPDWITFTPDSKKMYVANAHDNTVSVIDVAARKELTKIKVGQVPKRNITAIIPAFTGTTQ